MNWQLIWTDSAKKDLQKLDKHIAKQIILKMTSVLENTKDPTQFLAPLKYGKKGQFKYRIEKYRILCVLEVKVYIVLAISLGYKRDIYKR